MGALIEPECAAHLTAHLAANTGADVKPERKSNGADCKPNTAPDRQRRDVAADHEPDIESERVTECEPEH